MTSDIVREACVYRVPMLHPGDTSRIERLFDDGTLAPDEIVAIFGKTEGNGCVNDFTRGYAALAVETLLAERLNCTRTEVASRVAIVLSGGTEGGLSPHFIVFGVKDAAGPASDRKALAVGIAFTRPFAPEEIGRLAQVDATADAVRAAMASAGLESETDVHFVQIKCPLLTNPKLTEARARGALPVTEDTYTSMGLSRAASALGVAVALGEVESGRIAPDSIGTDLSLWSGRASASAGVELDRNVVIVLGNGAGWAGPHAIHHGVMRDGIDLPAIRDVLHAAGLPSDGQLSPEQAVRVSAVLVKADPPRSGDIRGARHIMWDDSDVHATRHARALVGGVVAAAIGRTDLFVSGGAEHQGPDGGGPVAVIVRRE